MEESDASLCRVAGKTVRAPASDTTSRHASTFVPAVATARLRRSVAEIHSALRRDEHSSTCRSIVSGQLHYRT
ncbi:hypothetical protein A33K_18189 [Burkholderia humptydooensis MSMB43]|uniref:Uncharacterized protein n=1 Tax=Burkholderia humptydooensis MSMB43 TaxID=441157 RepID=A0ABN0FZ18_9BURK|nr:hypothetical protein A33K_18189 [Burkholderia humptydooensis MSMB43]